jgi:hypothetical protein
MLDLAAKHVVSLVFIVVLVAFIHALLGYMNTEILEVLKAAAIAQQNS